MDKTLFQESYENFDDLHLPPFPSHLNSTIGGFEGSEHINENYDEKFEKAEKDSQLRQRKVKTKSTKKKETKSSMLTETLKELIVRKKFQSADSSTAKDAAILSVLVELIVYLIYLFLLSVVVFSMISPIMFQLSTLWVNLFVTESPDGLPAFQDLSFPEDVWGYFENQLFTGLYSGENDTANDYTTLLKENILISNPRFRILKIRNVTCGVPNFFSREMKTCYAPYDGSGEDKYSFGLLNPKAFAYTEASILKSGNYPTDWTTYGGGGFVFELPTNDSKRAFQILQNAKGNRFIDVGTRAIFVDFTTYNPNLNLYSVIKLYIEYPGPSGLTARYDIQILELFRYVSSWDYLVLACEAAFSAFTFMYMMQDLMELLRKRLTFFYDWWNLIDLSVAGLSFAFIIVSIKLNVHVYSNVAQLTTPNSPYLEMNDFVYNSTIRTNVLGILATVAWIRLLKYVTFSKVMNEIFLTLTRAAMDIAVFTVMFLAVVFSFGAYAYINFGVHMFEYSLLIETFFALIRITLGDFDLEAFQRADKYGIIFFGSYAFVVICILINMFFAILADSYSTVKAESLINNDRYLMSEYTTECFYRFFRNIRLLKPPKELEPTENFGEWEKIMQKYGYTEKEICQSFLKINIENFKEEEKDNSKIKNLELENKVRKIDPEIEHLEIAMETFNAKIKNAFIKFEEKENGKALKSD